ncbi:hypothetical protein [Streptomyces sp. NPDC055186]
MAWRDRLRRRAARPDTADRAGRSGRTERSGAGADGPSGDGPDRSAPGGRGPSVSGSTGPFVPGDWDGGWRRTAPPELTVARAPIGVSDGLAFRDGLAAWQNPSFDAGLGHSLLPTAPAGLMRGVTGPAAPRTDRAAGGPLLLRAVRPEGADGADGAQGDASDTGDPDGAGRPPTARTAPVARRAGPGKRSGASGSGSGPSGTTPVGTMSSGTRPDGTTSPGTTSSGTTPADTGTSGSASSGSAPYAVRPSRSGPRGTGAVGAGSGAGPVVARSGDDGAAGAGRSGEAPPTRGITSADSPAVLSSKPSSVSSVSSVQRAAQPEAGPVVTPADTGRQSAAAEIPLVRRVSVVPGADAGGGVARPASGGPAVKARSGAPGPASGPASGRASRSQAGSGSRTPAGPTVQRAATGTTGTPAARGGRPAEEPGAARTSGAEAFRPAVPLRPVGPRLTVARRQAGPVRRVPAVRPAATPPPGKDAAPESRGPASSTSAPAVPEERSTEPAQRSVTREGSRTTLGAPLSGLPSTAAPSAGSAPAPSSRPGPGPVLPVVQRQAEGAADGTPGPYAVGAKGTAGGAPEDSAAPADAPRRTSGRPGARARGGLGAPLSALPPSADLPGSAASGARASRPAPGQDVQRAPVRQDRRSAAAPVPPTAERTPVPTGTAPPTASLASGGAGAGAPLLGAGDGRRRPADRSATGGTTSPGPVDHANGPATPLVVPSQAAVSHRTAPEGTADTAGPAGEARRPGTTSGPAGPGGPRPRDPGASGPVVVARAVAAGAGGVPTPGTAGRHPLPTTRSATPHAPTATRTLSLLALRPLSLNTRTGEGTAQPAGSGSAGRPVVAARWPGAAPAAVRSHPGTPTGAPARPVPGSSALPPATPQVQRATTAPRRSQGPDVWGTGSPGSVRHVPVVRPAPDRARGASDATAPTTALPAATAPPARPLPVTSPRTPPLTDRPSAAPAPAGAIPVVRPATGTPGPGPAAGSGTGRATSSRAGRAALPVQRATETTETTDTTVATDTGGAAVPRGVPAQPEPARGRPRSASAPAAPGRGADRHAETPQDPGADLDDLARRLLDPMARLLRTELRRGRERTGRPYDGRR